MRKSGIALTTIGTKISFAKETVSGERPTTGYKVISGFTATPDFNPAPDSIETTPLDEEHNHTYTDGLLDYGNALAFRAILSQKFYDEYSKVVEDSESGFAESPQLATWVCVDIQGLSKSHYIPVKPLPLGLPALEVNNAVEVDVHMVPIGGAEIEADPTYAE